MFHDLVHVTKYNLAPKRLEARGLVATEENQKQQEYSVLRKVLTGFTLRWTSQTRVMPKLPYSVRG